MSGICAATICDLVLVLSPLGAVESTNCNLSGTARRPKPRMSAVPLPSPESIAHASTRTARATAACRHLLVLTRMAMLRLDRSQDCSTSTGCQSSCTLSWTLILAVGTISCSQAFAWCEGFCAVRPHNRSRSRERSLSVSVARQPMCPRGQCFAVCASLDPPSDVF